MFFSIIFMNPCSIFRPILVCFNKKLLLKFKFLIPPSPLRMREKGLVCISNEKGTSHLCIFFYFEMVVWSLRQLLLESLLDITFKGSYEVENRCQTELFCQKCENKSQYPSKTIVHSIIPLFYNNNHHKETERTKSSTQSSCSSD